MNRYVSARGVRYVALGLASCIVTIVCLELLVPRSASLQSILHIGQSANGNLAAADSSCVVAKKDLKNEVFFVSCGGFF